MSFFLIDESYGRGARVGRGLGVGATLGVGVSLGVEVGVGVGVGVISCTSNDPMSMRPFFTRSKPGSALIVVRRAERNWDRPHQWPGYRAITRG